MAELLLELFSEEIPARMQLPMAENLRRALEEKLNKEGVFNTGVRSYATPRRLALEVAGLSLTQEDVVVEKKGPKVGAPEQAIEGFLRSTGLKMNDLTKRQTDKGEFYFAVQKQKGKPTKDVIMEAVEQIIPSLTWPKSMRWGANEIRWVRPLHSILCVFGGDILPISFGHLIAGNTSSGHRFLSKGQFAANDFDTYQKELRSRSVILDTKERMEIILEKAEALAKSKGLALVQDEELLTEVAGLVEWPEVFMGKIDEDYMKVPDEVLISSIRKHQKYFCLRDKKGAIAPFFLVVSNMKTDDNGAMIIAGNERVLRARLSDANFFWDQDRRKPLADKVPNLERIIFHAKLGTVAQKTERIKALAKFIAMWVPHANFIHVERAAMLAKADLATDMVGEFPDLQGLMGCYYAAESDEREEIALAIKEHYSPLGPKDSCPKLPVSIAVAIADKVDTLAGLFAIDEKPTGSKDPFALRRAALGVIRIIVENNLSVPLRILFEQALKQYPKSLFKQDDDEEEKKNLLQRIKPAKKVKPSEVTKSLLEFFSERLKALLKAENIRHDLITAVFDGGSEDDLSRLMNRVSALDRFLVSDDGINLLAAYKRATNIVRIEEKKDNKDYSGKPSKSLLENAEEKMLFEVMGEIEDKIHESIKEDNFEEAMGLLSRLRSPIDAFFENVTVNADDQDLRKNRLRLLSQMRELLNEIANFSLIEG